ncbi:MAG TPA: acetate uptake transporter [Patescibacteria group bacterium]|nr:acetate uptake transporter [Patescibacteria group bacterium]
MTEGGKFANPAPLGLAGFGVSAIVLSAINAGFLKQESFPVVVPLAFAFGGFVQMIAGVLEFVNGDTFAMVAFTSFGAFWWWYALLLWTIGAGWLKAPSNAAIGVTLLVWGIFTLYMWIATFRTSFTLWLIFLLALLTFLSLAAGNLGMGTVWIKLGGWFGIGNGIGALYLSFAGVMFATFGRRVIAIGGPLVKS